MLQIVAFFLFIISIAASVVTAKSFMPNFRVVFKKGKKGKIDHFRTVRNVQNTDQARAHFLTFPIANNAIIRTIEILPPNARSGRPAKIMHPLDRFIQEHLTKRKKKHKDLLIHLNLHRSSWLKIRQRPEILSIEKILSIAEFLKVDWKHLSSAAVASITINTSNDSSDQALDRS